MDKSSDQIFAQLAAALDKLPNSFPRTKSGVEIRILQEIFSAEEAELAAQLTGTMESSDSIAARIGIDSKETIDKLIKLAKRGLIWFTKKDGTIYFRLAPFIVGIYEANLENMDHEFAHLFDQYILEAGHLIMKYNPAIHRALPSVSLAKSEWILPYDDVKAIIEKAKSYSVRDCICRIQQDYVGKGCNYPRHNCLILNLRDRPPRLDDITGEQALAVLDEAERVGLVHCVGNHQEGITYICNCCGCCCGVLRGITEWGYENSVAQSNYYAVIDPDLCSGCGTCIERCQVDAIMEQDGVSTVNKKMCIGCGLCVTGCPDNVPELLLKPEDEIIHPPVDYGDWEKERLKSRRVY